MKNPCQLVSLRTAINNILIAILGSAALADMRILETNPLLSITLEVYQDSLISSS